MDRAFSKNRIISLIIISLAMVVGITIALNPLNALIVLGGSIIFISFFIFPQIVIPLLLITRSSLDIFTDIGFPIGPMIFNVPSITSLFLLVGGGLYILFEGAVKKGLFLNNVGKIFLWWVLILPLWIVVSCFHFGIGGGLFAAREWVRLASLFMIYILVYQLSQRIGYKKIVNYLLWALPIPLASGLYQIVTSTGIKVSGINRVYGTLAHPNSFAFFLVIFIGLTLWKMRFSQMRLIWLALLATEALILINTFSINGIIMLLTMSAILMCKTLKAKRRFLIFTFALIVLISFSFSNYGKKRLNEISQTGNIIQIIGTGKTVGEGSMAWRALNWHLLLEKWSQRPVFGYGLSATVDLVSPLKNVPHNDYLRFLVETGIVGLCMFLFLLTAAGNELWKLYKSFKVEDPELSYLLLVVFSLYIAWVIGSISDNFITATSVQYYLWAFFAALMATKKNQESIH